MGKGEGGNSYGFAPHGRLGEQNVERLVRPQLDKKPPLAETLATPSSSPNWPWLLIGILLGSGGTLIASSFWLQESYVSPSVAMDSKPAGAQIEGNGPASSGTKTAEAAAIISRAVESAEIDRLMRDGRANSPQAGSVRPSDAADDESEIAAETRAYPRPANAERTSGSETLLLSRDEPDRAGSTAVSAANINDGSPSASPGNRRLDDETAALAALDSLKRTVSSIDGLRDRANADRTQTETIATAAGGPKQSFDGSEFPAAATDVLAVTPRRSSFESIDAGISRRGTIETANVDSAVRERSVSATLEEVQRRAKRVYRVQLAAVDTENAAQIYWREAKTRLPDALDGVQPVFDQREVDERVFFRVWIGAFDKRADADNYCGWLKSKGQDCFVTLG